ncbi:hypothetical protein [Kribbella sp. NPDC050459]|uniref:hypothetical protein n=1 Tax=Kribbella sp. NPDC050459 TaxID=3155785 RepID=UPI0034032DFD
MVLKYTFAVPLPAGSIATIVRGDPARVPVVPVKSALSADRTTLTASRRGKASWSRLGRKPDRVAAVGP